MEETRMEELIIPSEQEISRMSYIRSQKERLRLLNEIVFARDDEEIGGAPHDETIMACKEAIEAIDEHLQNLGSKEAKANESVSTISYC
jgi:hypothetical protein